MTNVNTRSYVYLIATMLFWAGTFVSSKIIATSVHPVISAFIRFSLATLALMAPLLLQHKKVPLPNQKEWFLLFILALTGPIGFNLLFFKGLQYIEAGRASLIVALNPLLITVAAAIFLGEKMKLRQFLGLVIALTGVIYVLSKGDWGKVFTGGVGLGEMAIFGAVMSWTVHSLVGKRVMEKFCPLHSVFYSSLIGSVLLFLLALNFDLGKTIAHIDSKNWANFLFLGTLGTAAATTLYYAAIQKIGASCAGAFMNLVPFFAVILSWLILTEPITAPVIFGGIMLTFGVYLTGKKSLKVNI